MYANGSLVASGADKTGNIGTVERMAIGNCNTAYENGFQGLMDELSIYNEVLTAEEIADHYNTGTGIHSNRNNGYSCSGIGLSDAVC